MTLHGRVSRKGSQEGAGVPRAGLARATPGARSLPPELKLLHDLRIVLMVLAGMVEEGLAETKEIADIVDVREIAGRKKEKARQTEDIFRLKKRGLTKKEIADMLGITEGRVSHRLDGI